MDIIVIRQQPFMTVEYLGATNLAFNNNTGIYTITAANGVTHDYEKIHYIVQILV